MKFTIDPLPVYPDILISLLYLGGNPPRFHWYLYVQHPDASSGTKIHATGINGNWWYERIEYSLQHDPAVAAAAVIGKLNATTHTLDDLDATLKEIPMLEVPQADAGREPKFTCRVWLREYENTAAEDIEGDMFKGAKLVRAKSSF